MLPVRPAAELEDSNRELLEPRPDLLSAVLPILMERFPTLPHEEIMLIAGIPSQNLRHTRAAQDWIEEGRQEGQAKVVLRQLSRR